MARRLIEIGVPFVEVCYARWDHHNGLYTGRSAATPPIQEMSAVADQGTAALITDLHDRGLLVAYGPFANAQEEGATAVFTTREAAEGFASGDPFVLNGVVRESWQVREWLEAFLP